MFITIHPKVQPFQLFLIVVTHSCLVRHEGGYWRMSEWKVGTPPVRRPWRAVPAVPTVSCRRGLRQIIGHFFGG